jgi:hypothetical protein
MFEPHGSRMSGGTINPDLASSTAGSLMRMRDQLHPPPASWLCAIVLEFEEMALRWICGDGVLPCPQRRGSSKGRRTYSSARKMQRLDRRCLATHLGTPRGRYDEHSGKFPSVMKPSFNRTSRRKNQLPKVDASWLGDNSRQFIYSALSGA